MPAPSSPPEAVPHIPEADTFQVRASLDTLRQAIIVRRWLIVATVLLTTLIVSGYVWIWPPTFESEVEVAADSDKDQQRISSAAMSSPMRPH